MTRKDYVLLAKTIASAAVDGDESEREYWAKLIADALAGDNPRFDRERFLKASGL